MAGEDREPSSPTRTTLTNTDAEFLVVLLLLPLAFEVSAKVRPNRLRFHVGMKTYLGREPQHMLWGRPVLKGQG